MGTQVEDLCPLVVSCANDNETRQNDGGGKKRDHHTVVSTLSEPIGFLSVCVVSSLVPWGRGDFIHDLWLRSSKQGVKQSPSGHE